MLKNSQMGAKRAGALKMVLAVVAAASLVSCGGEAIEKFQPDRVTAFGDETSAFVGDGNGQRYTIQADPSTTGGSYDCRVNGIWVQAVANSFGTSLQNCTGNLQINSNLGRSWAVAGARVGTPGSSGGNDIADQVSAYKQAGFSFGGKDLVLMQGGMNDVLALYQSYDPANAAASRADILSKAEGFGTNLGTLVVQITDEGAKVVIADLPSVGETPYGAAQDLVLPGARQLLTDLTSSFNRGLGRQLGLVKGGGHSAGLVRLNALHDDIYNNSNNAYGLILSPACKQTFLVNINVSQAPTPAPFTDCVDDSAATPPYSNATNGLQSTPSASTAQNTMFMDYLRYSPVTQAYFTNAALSVAHNNPF